MKPSSSWPVPRLLFFGDEPFYHAPQPTLTTAAGLGASALALRAPSDAPSVQHRTQCLSPQTAGGAQPSSALGARFTRIWTAIDKVEVVTEKPSVRALVRVRVQRELKREVVVACVHAQRG